MIREQVLFVDDEDHIRMAGAQTLELADIAVLPFGAGEDALRSIGPDFDGVLVTDIRMPGMDGVEVLRRTLAIDPDIPVVLVTGHGDVDLAVECIKMGAYDFIEKPWQAERLVTSVRRAAERRRLVLENRALKQQLHLGKTFRDELFGRSAPMDRLRQSLAAIARTDVNVLITGQTGTGKEVAAQLLHRQSARRDGPFVHINCAALPETLMESELFGHEAGAFPGAMRARFGKLEHAKGGTLCLDEVDLLPMPLQAKLLDVLHNRIVTRLGSNDTVALDFRVVAISKSNLEDAAAAGRFRSDLLYRLNVATLRVPQLKDRREDIPGLFARFVALVANENDLPVPEIPPEMLNALSARNWPGNVRELRNEAERFVLGLTDFAGAAPDTSHLLADRVAAFERALISAAISANDGQIKATYESLGLSRRSLYDKMQKHGISRADFGDDD